MLRRRTASSTLLSYELEVARRLEDHLVCGRGAAEPGAVAEAQLAGKVLKG